MKNAPTLAFVAVHTAENEHPKALKTFKHFLSKARQVCGETGCSEETGALSGVVRSDERTMLAEASARVYARPEGAEPIETLTGDDGVYIFSALPAGEWSLDAVSANGSCSSSGAARVSVTPCGTHTLDLYVDVCLGR